MENFFTRLKRSLLPLLFLAVGLGCYTTSTAQMLDVVSVYPTYVPTCMTTVVTIPVVATGRMSTGVVPTITVHFFNGRAPYVSSATVTGSARDSFFINIPAVYFTAGTYPIAVVASGGGLRDSMYVPSFITLRSCPKITLKAFEDCNRNCRKDSFEQYSMYTVNVRSSGGSINYNLNGTASAPVLTSPAIDSTYTITFTGLGFTTCSSPTTYTFRFTGDTTFSLGAVCSYDLDLVWANDTLPTRRGCDTTNLKYSIKIKSSTLSNVMTNVRIHHGDGTSATYPVYLNAIGEANAIFNHDYTRAGIMNISYAVSEPISGTYDSIYTASAYYVDTLCFMVSGYTFNDCDSNCSKGSGETAVPNATVTFNGTTYTSDVNGYFSFMAPSGPFTIAASKPGYIFRCSMTNYLTAPLIISLGAKCSSATTSLDILSASDTNRTYIACDTNRAHFRINASSYNYPLGTPIYLKVYFGDGTSANYSINTTATPINNFTIWANHVYSGSGSYNVSYVLLAADGRKDSVYVPGEVFIPYCGGVNGYFYSDCDSDCVRDSSELYTSFGYLQFQTLPSGPIYTASATSGGYYSISLAPGSYRVYPSAAFRIVCPDSGTTIVTVPASGYVSRDFGVECRISLELVSLSVFADSGTYCAPHPARATVSGVVYGYPASTRIRLEMFYDDGVMDTMSVFTTSASVFTFTRVFRHTYRTGGIYNPGCVAILPDGRRDTIHRYRYMVYDSCGSIRGTVYHDVNGDCILDSRDTRMARVPVALYIGGIYSRAVFTDAMGNYVISVPAGVAVRISVPVTYTGLSTTCPTSGSYSFTSSTSSSSYLFGYGCRTGAYDLATRLSNVTTLRAGSLVTVRFSSSQYLRICTPVSGSVSLTVDSRLRYQSATPAPASISGSTYTWNFTTTTSIWSLLNSIVFRADSSLMPTDTICFTLNIIPTSGDINLVNNTQRICLPVGRSYDPNMKESDLIGEGIEGYVDNNQTLTYTIHFQNTGNDTAMHVFVFDNIDTDLDMETLEILDASHDMNVYREGRTLKFDFPDIMLPDSARSTKESQGYFTYRIAMNPGLPAGTRIENYADIHFDWNDPIRTNTTLHTIRILNGIQDVINGMEVHIFPNPATSYIDVQLDSPVEGTIQILDMRGALVTETVINGNQVRANINGVAPGMYLVRLQTESGLITSRRIIILN